MKNITLDFTNSGVHLGIKINNVYTKYKGILMVNEPILLEILKDNKTWYKTYNS